MSEKLFDERQKTFDLSSKLVNYQNESATLSAQVDLF